MPDGHCVSLLRTPEHYPTSFEWNVLYREALKKKEATKNAFVVVRDVMAAVDAEVLDAGFLKEQEYTDWVISWRNMQADGVAHVAVDAEIRRGTEVLYRQPPAGLSSHDGPHDFENPYVDVIVSDQKMAMAMLWAFKGT